MGASSSTTEQLSNCDHDILKYVIGRRGAHIKDIFLRFTEQQKLNSPRDTDRTPHPVMEDANQFANIFTSTNNDHSDLSRFFEVLDDKNTRAVDFYEAIATLAVCSNSSALTKTHLLFQIFDWNSSGFLTRAELLLMLRSSVAGVRKLCGFAPLSIKIFERLVSHAFAASSDRAQQNVGISYMEISSWMRDDPDVKHFLTAVSPASIHSAQSRRRGRHSHSTAAAVSSSAQSASGMQPGRLRKKTAASHNDAEETATSTQQQHHGLHHAVASHDNHCLDHIHECRELRLMFKAMDSDEDNKVTLEEFANSLPATLKPMASDMFRSMSNGKYLLFQQLLHEIYPYMTHEEIDMLCAATAKVKKIRRPPPVQLTSDQTEEMCALFDMYDTDHSGQMSVAEMTAALTATGVFTEKECKKYFDLADYQHHNHLSKADFIHFFKESFVAVLGSEPVFQTHPDDFHKFEEISNEHSHVMY